MRPRLRRRVCVERRRTRCPERDGSDPRLRWDPYPGRLRSTVDRRNRRKRGRARMPRVIVWAAHLALPLAGLWLLLSRPGTDVIWQHHQTHFWLVMIVAGVNVVVGVAM